MTAGSFTQFAVVFAIVAAHSDARAECALKTPECHLANGKKLIDSDPKRASEELLASYSLDERTDTLTLYAQALQRDKRYVRALETWQRIIIFRESEIESAKEAIRATGSSRKREAARRQQRRAQEQSEIAAAEIIKLWSNVGRVRLQMSAEQPLTVIHEGIAIDASKDIIVNAGRDELQFASRSGEIVGKLVVEVAAGQAKTIKAPSFREMTKTAAKSTKSTKSTKSKTASKSTRKLEATETPIETPIAKPIAKQPKPPKLPKLEPKLPEKSVVERDEPELAATAFSDEQPRSRTMARVGLGLGVGGLVGLGVAGTFGLLSMRDFDRAQTAGCSSDGQCPVGRAVDLAERSNDRARIAQISAIGGGALLVTGATMYLLGRRSEKRASSSITLDINSSSATIGWSFQ